MSTPVRNWYASHAQHFIALMSLSLCASASFSFENTHKTIHIQQFRHCLVRVSHFAYIERASPLLDVTAMPLSVGWILLVRRASLAKAPDALASLQLAASKQCGNMRVYRCKTNNNKYARKATNLHRRKSKSAYKYAWERRNGHQLSSLSATVESEFAFVP